MQSRLNLRFSFVLMTFLSWAPFFRAQEAAEADDPFVAVRSYEQGQPRRALHRVESMIRSASAVQRREIETRLLALLQSPQATCDAKEWVCRQLRQVGTEQAIAVLVPLLADASLCTVARLALQSIPGEEVNQALREVIPKLAEDLKAGVILTLGARGDRDAVPLLAPLVNSSERSIAEAALYALGHIGGEAAQRAIRRAKGEGDLGRYRRHALLLVAEGLAREGQTTAALALYHDLFRSSDNVARIGALRGIVACDKRKSLPMITNALRDPNPALRAVAVTLVCELSDPVVAKTVVAGYRDLSPRIQIQLFGRLTEKAVLPTLLDVIDRDSAEADDSVRAAALTAVGRLGDAAAVDPLLRAAASDRGPIRDAARQSLRSLRGPTVEKALLDAARTGKETARLEAMVALGARRATAAAGTLIKAAQSGDPDIELAAVQALEQVAEVRHVAALVDRLESMGSSPEAPLGVAIERALAAICRRADNRGAVTEVVLGEGQRRSTEVRARLLRVLLARLPSRPCASRQRARRPPFERRRSTPSRHGRMRA